MSASRSLEEFMLAERIARLRALAAQRTRNLAVALDGVHDPRNLSAVARSLDAFGLLDLHAIESHTHFRVSERVSQGSDKWLDIHRHRTPEECLAVLQASDLEIWVADAREGSRIIDLVPFERRLCLVFGNEHEGVSAPVRAAAAGSFRIPMYGFVDSLNVSVAVGISLAVAVRRREALLGQHADLAPAECEALVREWQRRSVRHADLILRRLANPEP